MTEAFSLLAVRVVELDHADANGRVHRQRHQH
jgi:hypothetical protein